MTIQYKILRWDGVIYGTSNNKYPMVYIIPDLALLEFFEANDYKVNCKINNSESQYDDSVITGQVDSSALFPNCRPNFYAETGTYVVTLMMNWNGYPSSDGYIEFPDFETDTTPIMIVNDALLLGDNEKKNDTIAEDYDRLKVQKRKRKPTETRTIKQQSILTNITNSIRDNICLIVLIVLAIALMTAFFSNYVDDNEKINITI